MGPWLERCRVLVPAVWAGLLLCIAAIATPAPFATLTPADAAKVVGRIFAQEAYTSLGVGVAMLLLERRQAASRAHRHDGSRFSVELLLVLGALFCTIAGYFALQPLMATARTAHGALSFGQLHAMSMGFFGLKILLVLVLAARATRQTITPPSIS